MANPNRSRITWPLTAYLYPLEQIKFGLRKHMINDRSAELVETRLREFVRLRDLKGNANDIREAFLRFEEAEKMCIDRINLADTMVGGNEAGKAGEITILPPDRNVPRLSASMPAREYIPHHPRTRAGGNPASNEAILLEQNLPQLHPVQRHPQPPPHATQLTDQQLMRLTIILINLKEAMSQEAPMLPQAISGGHALVATVARAIKTRDVSVIRTTLRQVYRTMMDWGQKSIEQYTLLVQYIETDGNQ